jgi:cytochrome b561
MIKRLQYGATSKILHWTVVALLIVQFPIGWLMPDIKRGATPGAAMTLHISIGILLLILIAVRFVWRLTHPVAAEQSLPQWQRIAAESLHWLLYALIFATTMSGWFFASARGWAISWFYVVPLPMLMSGDPTIDQDLGRYHHNLETALIILVGAHVLAALVHYFYYRDRILHRMLPQLAPDKTGQ